MIKLWMHLFKSTSSLSLCQS